MDTRAVADFEASSSRVVGTVFVAVVADTFWDNCVRCCGRCSCCNAFVTFEAVVDDMEAALLSPDPSSDVSIIVDDARFAVVGATIPAAAER